MPRRKKTSAAHPARPGQDQTPHIYLRGKVYYVRYWQDGQEHRRSTGKTSLPAAKAWVALHVPAECLVRARREGPRGYDWQRAMALDIERARNKRLSEAYIAYDVVARHKLLAFFQGATHIDADLLRKFRDHNRRADREDGSTRRAIVVLRRSCGLLRKKDKLQIWVAPKEDNPELVAVPRNAKLRGAYIDPRLLRAWLDVLPKRARAVAVLELTTGMRASELRRLSPENLTPTGEYPGVSAFIALPEGVGKDKTGRNMALCDAAYDALRHLWTYPSMDYSPRAAWRVAAKRVGLKAAGRPPGRVHERDMRHNFATVNSEHWADVQGLMRAMGHETGSKDRYQTATPSRLVKFATFSAQYFGLVPTSTGEGCT